jgi:hypothetical protein
MWILSVGQRRAMGRLGLLVVSALALPVTAAIAADVGDDHVAADRPTANFWPDAQRMLASQANWFDRAEKAISTPDPLVNQILSTKLLTQLRSMDLFVQRYDRHGAIWCQSSQANVRLTNAGLDATQIAAYCAIAKLSRDLMPLRERLTQRASQFNPQRTIAAAPQFFTQSNRGLSIPTSIEQVNLRAKSPAAPPAQTLIHPQMVGVQRFKQLQANDRLKVAPAIAPPTDLMALINQGREQLVKVQAGIPAQSQGFGPRGSATDRRSTVQVFKPPTPTVSKFAVRDSEVDAFQSLLAQPHTGIGRVYPSQSFVADTNRLTPTNIPMPFGLRIEDGQFLLAGAALNYGFVTDIGDVDLANVQATQALPELFKTYAPPNTLAAIENHQRRFLSGKDTPLSSMIPAQLNRTYVMRLVQYQLPEIVTSGRPLASGDRGQLKTLLQHQGSDRLIAFRPVIQRNDGSYTVLWKVLDRKAAPLITDLDQYVSLNLKTRSRN